jgi:CHAD domain
MPSDRSATGTVRAALLEHAASAARSLASAPPSAVNVHAARKQIKRARSALRLLRGALAALTYRREDAALRRAARALNAARDARVLLRTLEALRRRRSALGKDPAAAALARVLGQRQARAQRQLRLHPELLAGARAALLQLQARARRWPLGRHGWARLAPGFRRIYRAGRRAGRAARRRPEVLTLHQWRKKVQYLWHALQMLEPLHAGKPPRIGELARRLSDLLGDDHDLALLQAAVMGAARRPRAASGPLLAAIEQRRARLQIKALAAGKRLYARKPGAMAARIGRGCTARRS